MKDKMKVVIQMLTYNHERYVEQAIMSVIDQQTDFPYLLLISDDCSTDGTAAICKKMRDVYPDKIRLKLNEKNAGVLKNSADMHRDCMASGADYVAICEGDDYWTNPRKLQEQVDFLERNSDHTIVWTTYQSLKGSELSTPEWTTIFDGKPSYEITLSNIFNRYCTYAITVLYRNHCITPTEFERFSRFKDNTIYSLCLSKGRGIILNTITAVYRYHSGGTYSSISVLNQAYVDYRNLEEIVATIPACENAHYRQQLVNSLAMILKYSLRSQDKTKLPITIKTTFLKLLLVSNLRERLYFVRLMFNWLALKRIPE